MATFIYVAPFQKIKKLYGVTVLPLGKYHLSHQDSRTHVL
jgi:hypothetical protein